MPPGGVGAALHSVERSLGSILSFSFFITRQMKTDLQAGKLSGTLPILYVFLARSGKTIRDVSPIALDAKDHVHVLIETGGSAATAGEPILSALRVLVAGGEPVPSTATPAAMSEPAPGGTRWRIRLTLPDDALLHGTNPNRLRQETEAARRRQAVARERRAALERQWAEAEAERPLLELSLIHISEPTRPY